MVTEAVTGSQGSSPEPATMIRARAGWALKIQLRTVLFPWVQHRRQSFCPIVHASPLPFGAC